MAKLVNAKITAGTGAGTVYIPVDADYTVLGFYVTPSAVTGCVSTVSVYSGATAVGTAAITAAQAAGTITASTMNSTLATRKTKVTKTIPIKVSVDARTNSTEIYVGILLDEHALQSD